MLKVTVLLLLLLVVTIDFISSGVRRDLALAICCYVVIVTDAFFTQLAIGKRSHPLLGILRLGRLLFMLMGGGRSIIDDHGLL